MFRKESVEPQRKSSRPEWRTERFYPGNWWTFAVTSKGIYPRAIRHAFDIKTKYFSDEIHQQSFVTKGFYKKLMNMELEW